MRFDVGGLGVAGEGWGGKMRRCGACWWLAMAVGVAGCKVERPPNAEFQSFVDQADVTAVLADTTDDAGADVAVDAGPDAGSEVGLETVDTTSADAGNPAEVAAETPSSCKADCATSGCGDGKCADDETAPNCPTDCGFLAVHLGGSCTNPGSQDTCAHGYVCTARSVAGGGHVCAADFETWGVLGDARPDSDFEDAGDYVKDTKTGLAWAKESLEPMNWTEALTACTTKGYGGLQDWRLPTRAALLSLVDFTKKEPAAASKPGWPAVPYFWSTVPQVASGSAWVVVFYVGFSVGDNTAYPYGVRCVR